VSFSKGRFYDLFDYLGSVCTVSVRIAAGVFSAPYHRLPSDCVLSPSHGFPLVTVFLSCGLFPAQLPFAWLWLVLMLFYFELFKMNPVFFRAVSNRHFKFFFSQFLPLPLLFLFLQKFAGDRLISRGTLFVALWL